MTEQMRLTTVASAAGGKARKQGLMPAVGQVRAQCLWLAPPMRLIAQLRRGFNGPWLQGTAEESMLHLHDKQADAALAAPAQPVSTQHSQGWEGVAPAEAGGSSQAERGTGQTGLSCMPCIRLMLCLDSQLRAAALSMLIC